MSHLLTTDYISVLGNVMSRNKLVKGIIGLAIGLIYLWTVCQIMDMINYKFALSANVCIHFISFWFGSDKKGVAQAACTFCVATFILMLLPEAFVIFAGANAILVGPYFFEKRRKESMA